MQLKNVRKLIGDCNHPELEEERESRQTKMKVKSIPGNTAAEDKARHSWHRNNGKTLTRLLSSCECMMRTDGTRT